MAKFSNSTPARRAVSTVSARATTHEGGSGFRYDARTELWNLTTAAMVGGEKSFYENGEVKDARVAALVNRIVREDGGFEWICRFVPFLRTKMFMRTAPVMIAAEAAKARQVLIREDSAARGGSTNRAPKIYNPEFTVRRLVASAIGRPDEFGEFVGYWRLRFGRAIPGGVQRGLADAFAERINEFSALKYDGSARSHRMGDLIDIIHPTPKAPWQADLFRYLLDRSKHPQDIRANLEMLPMVQSRISLENMTVEERRIRAASPMFEQDLKRSGMTWENVAGWLQRELTASDWEALIPTMGYMALLRNLRNFDKAGISSAAQAQVIARLTDPEQVAKSMQFPYRFYTAYRAANETFNWAGALSTALDLSTQNVPAFEGKTLVIVDTSGSMNATVSERSDVKYVDVAALFASAVASRNPEGVDVVAFADTSYRVQFPTRSNVLKNVDHIRREVGKVGYGTNINSAQPHLKDHKRVVIFSDMQDAGGVCGTRPTWNGTLQVPADVTVYSFNLAGYEAGIVDTSKPNRFVLGGFSDKAFQMIEMTEKGRNQEWPF